MAHYVDPEQAAVYELAFRETFRAQAEQRGAVDRYRASAGLLLSAAAAAVATSIFGGGALEGHPSPFAWLALACFLLLGIGVVVCLWPPRAREYVVSPRRLIESYAEPTPLALPLIHRDVALSADATQALNREHLKRLSVLFRICSVLVVVETGAWVVDLTLTR